MFEIFLMKWILKEPVFKEKCPKYEAIELLSKLQFSKETWQENLLNASFDEKLALCTQQVRFNCSR